MPRSGARAGAQQLRRAQEARSLYRQMAWETHERRSLDNKPEPKWGLGYTFPQGRVIDRVWDIFKKEWAYWLQPPASAMSQHEISILESQLMNDANEQPKSIVDIMETLLGEDNALEVSLEVTPDPLKVIEQLALAEADRQAQIEAQKEAERQAELQAEKELIAGKFNEFLSNMRIPTSTTSNELRLGEYIIEADWLYGNTSVKALDEFVPMGDSIRLMVRSASISEELLQFAYDYDYMFCADVRLKICPSAEQIGMQAKLLKESFDWADVHARSLRGGYAEHLERRTQKVQQSQATEPEAPATDQRIESLLATVTALSARLSAMERLLEQAQIEDDEPVYMLTEAGKALAAELVAPRYEVKTLIQSLSTASESNSDAELADYLNNGWEVMHIHIDAYDTLHRIVTLRRELPFEPQPEPLPPMPDDDDQQGEQSPTLPKRKPVVVDGENVTMMSAELEQYLAEHPMARDIWNGLSVEEAKAAANQRAADVYTNVILKAHAEYLAECEDDSEALQDLFPLTAQAQKDAQNA